jgi:hypothetical protein
VPGSGCRPALRPSDSEPRWSLRGHPGRARLPRCGRQARQPRRVRLGTRMRPAAKSMCSPSSEHSSRSRSPARASVAPMARERPRCCVGAYAGVARAGRIRVGEILDVQSPPHPPEPTIRGALGAVLGSMTRAAEPGPRPRSETAPAPVVCPQARDPARPVGSSRSAWRPRGVIRCPRRGQRALVLRQGACSAYRETSGSGSKLVFMEELLHRGRRVTPRQNCALHFA